MTGDEEYYVQAIGVKMILPSGKQVFGKFMGVALCSPEEWEQLKASNTSIADALAPGGDAILFKDPEPIGNVVSKEHYNDIIDVVREELRREHHEDLREKGD